jgi:hypothetical protein
MSIRSLRLVRVNILGILDDEMMMMMMMMML